MALTRYFRSVWQEMQRVVWPSRRQVALHTGIVIASMIAIIAIVGVVDYLLVLLVRTTLLKG